MSNSSLLSDFPNIYKEEDCHNDTYFSLFVVGYIFTQKIDQRKEKSLPKIQV